jgi:hypothetical protein
VIHVAQWGSFFCTFVGKRGLSWETVRLEIFSICNFIMFSCDLVNQTFFRQLKEICLRDQFSWEIFSCFSPSKSACDPVLRRESYRITRPTSSLSGMTFARLENST